MLTPIEAALLLVTCLVALAATAPMNRETFPTSQKGTTQGDRKGTERGHFSQFVSSFSQPARADAIRDAQAFADTLWARVRNYETSLAHVRPDSEMLSVLNDMRRDARQAQADADRLSQTQPRPTEWTL